MNNKCVNVDDLMNIFPHVVNEQTIRKAILDIGAKSSYSNNRDFVLEKDEADSDNDAPFANILDITPEEAC